MYSVLTTLGKKLPHLLVEHERGEYVFEDLSVLVFVDGLVVDESVVEDVELQLVRQACSWLECGRGEIRGGSHCVKHWDDLSCA